jgi:general secretion pathway protein J
MRRGPGRYAGFTLIEVLISVFLLSVLSAFAYGTLNYVGKSREITRAAFERTRGLQLAVHWLVTDFEQLEPRPVREPIGDSSQPALLADARGANVVTLTRGGWPNPVGLPRGTLQRVSYRLDNGTLIRQYTTVLDTTLATVPVAWEIGRELSGAHEFDLPSGAKARMELPGSALAPGADSGAGLASPPAWLSARTCRALRCASSPPAT